MKHLLKHFKDLSIHPKNAAELKGLILQLAVQGKLTANWRLENPNVVPASVLLKRIQTEKAKLLKAGKIKKEKPLVEIMKEEIPFVLPEGWTWCRFQDVKIDAFTGLERSKNYQSFHFEFDYFKMNNIGDFGQCEWSKIVKVDASKNEVEKFKLNKGDFLFNTRNSYELVGKTCVIDKEVLKPILFNNNILKVDFGDFNSSGYINQMFNSPIIKEHLNAMKSATTNVAAIYQGKLMGLLIPIPPLEEQKAIVSTVNTLFAEVEQLEALTQERIQLKENFVTSALQQLTNSQTINGEWAFLQQHFPAFFTELPNIKKLRESILQLAVQGKLTTHWRKENPDTEDASVLLERIKAEKAQLVKEKKIKKENPLPKIKNEEMPYSLPDGWVWCRVGDILNLFLGGFAYKSAKFISSSSNQVLRLGNVKNNLIRFESNPVFVDDNYAKESIGYRLKKGDILITMTGTRAKKDYCFTTLLNETHFESRNLFLNQRVGCLRFSNNTSLGYVDLALKEPHLLTPIFDKATGTANQANIGKGAIIENLFPLPPFNEQKAIVEKVNALMALCDQLEQEIQNSKATQEDWMKSSLREVFAGQNEKAEAEDLIGGLGMVAEPGEKYRRVRDE
jgi:type I restriction enzyme S subunit